MLVFEELQDMAEAERIHDPARGVRKLFSWIERS